MIEEWRPVPGYGGYYEASSLGRIRVVDRIVVKRHRSGKLIKQKYSGRLLNPCKTDDLAKIMQWQNLLRNRLLRSETHGPDTPIFAEDMEYQNHKRIEFGPEILGAMFDFPRYKLDELDLLSMTIQHLMETR